MSFAPALSESQAGGIVERLRMVCDGKTIVEVAHAVELNSETVRRYLRGESQPSVEFIQRIGVAFDCSATWLLYGVGKQGRIAELESSIERLPLDRLVAALCARFQALENSVRELQQSAQVASSEPSLALTQHTRVAAAV